MEDRYKLPKVVKRPKYQCTCVIIHPVTDFGKWAICHNCKGEV